MNNDIFAVLCDMYVGFNSEIAAVSRRGEGDRGILRLYSAESPVRYHLGFAFFDFNSLHFYHLRNIR